jgi:hypothetical protein
MATYRQRSKSSQAVLPRTKNRHCASGSLINCSLGTVRRKSYRQTKLLLVSSDSRGRTRSAGTTFQAPAGCLVESFLHIAGHRHLHGRVEHTAETLIVLDHGQLRCYGVGRIRIDAGQKSNSGKAAATGERFCARRVYPETEHRDSASETRVGYAMQAISISPLHALSGFNRCWSWSERSSTHCEVAPLLIHRTREQKHLFVGSENRTALIMLFQLFAVASSDGFLGNVERREGYDRLNECNRDVTTPTP